MSLIAGLQLTSVAAECRPYVRVGSSTIVSQGVNRYLGDGGDCISRTCMVEEVESVYRRAFKGKRWTMLGEEIMNRVPLVSLVVLLLSISPAQSQQLQNGGFENQLTGWTTSSSGGGGGLGVIGAGTEGYFCAKIVAISFGQESLATLSQTFSAHSGDVLQFDAEAPSLQNENGSCSVSLSTLGWSVDPTISPSDNFGSFSYTLPADASYTLSFQVSAVAVGPPGTEARATMWIDNVRTTAVPEPGALLLLGVGAAVLSVGYFKRKFG
jgi:hypothetical protein